MLYCPDCYRTFYEPITVRENYGLPGGWRLLPACPYCKQPGVMRHDPV